MVSAWLNNQFDDLLTSQKAHFLVIPAKANQRRSLAGIQNLPLDANHLDSGFHRSDGFLQSRQISVTTKNF
jgi:hypothetical protein